jgi:hypothetical protein
VELLVAMLITLLVMSAALAFLGPARDAFDVQPESADMQQRVRVAIDTLQRDVLMAGAGMYAAGTPGPLHQVIAPLLPYSAFATVSDAARGVFFRRDTISVLSVPWTASQTTLAEPMRPGSLEIVVEQPANCPAAVPIRVCGFDTGDSLLVFDRDGRWDVFTVDDVDGAAGRLRLRGDAPQLGYETGANVAEIRAVTYWLKDDPLSGAQQLVRAEGRDRAQPVVDHMVKLEFEYFGEPDRTPGAHLAMPPEVMTDGPWYPDAAARNRFDADLLHVRRVRITLRVQTPVASLRGPAGRLFSNGGIARAGSRFLPDMEVQFDVSPRNLNLVLPSASLPPDPLLSAP